MNFSHHPNRALRVRPALRCGHQQSLGQRLEIEPAIEPVGEGAEVLRCILSKSEAVVAAAQTGLEVSQHRVDPLQLGYVFGFAPCHDSAFMGASGLGHRPEARQTIRIDGAARGQAFFGPVCDGFELEAGHRAEFDPQGVALISEGDRRHKGHLVFGATSDLATCALAAQIGIIHLDFATERVECFTFSHGLHQFVLHQPRRWVAHAELTFESQSRQTSLGLADEVNCQKPYGQRQFGRLKDGASNQRCLMPTGIALKNLVAEGVQDAVCGTTAARTAKTIWPTCILQRCRAKRFRAKELEELRHRQTGLKLDAVHSHDVDLKIDTWVQITAPQAHQVSLAELHC